VGRREVRETDVLLLKIKYPNAPGLKPNPNVKAAHGTEGRDLVSFTAVPLSSLAGAIENILGIPVIDRTGTSLTYDFTLKMDGQSQDPELLKQTVLDQLGLELVPARERIEVLVVEKQK
jgi:uncharacterized protein (TIGR03435 family)